jgi:hypothetical protein
MSKTLQVIGILCSDLHFSTNPPIARSLEPDWFEAMRRPCRILRELVSQFDCPVVAAGDIFHTWKSPPELINFVLAEMPDFYAIPGQHDLPFHNLGDIHRSAYWTLVQAGKIKDLCPGRPCSHHSNRKGVPELVMHAFPWGVPVKPNAKRRAGAVHLAVIHAYCWAGEHGFKNAAEEQRLGAYGPALEGYDAAVFGDNHKGFLLKHAGVHVLNNGTFMRRSSDERKYRPSVGLLYSDGTIKRHFLDTPDLFLPEGDKRLEMDEDFDMQDFVKELESLGDESLDFKQAVRHYLKTHEVSPGARRIMLLATGENEQQ